MFAVDGPQLFEERHAVHPGAGRRSHVLLLSLGPGSIPRGVFFFAVGDISHWPRADEKRSRIAKFLKRRLSPWCLRIRRRHDGESNREHLAAVDRQHVLWRDHNFARCCIGVGGGTCPQHDDAKEGGANCSRLQIHQGVSFVFGALGQILKRCYNERMSDANRQIERLSMLAEQGRMATSRAMLCRTFSSSS